jgi:hypothetical protein
MKVTIKNKLGSNISTSVGLIGPGETKSLEMTPESLYRAAAEFKVLEDNGRADIIITDEANRSDKAELVVNAILHTSTSTTLYVDAAGSDNNTGLSPDSPFKTIQAALDSLPKNIIHPINIKVGAGIFDGFVISGFTIKQPGYIDISGTLVTATATSGSATGTVTYFINQDFSTPTFATINVVGAGWTVDDFKGKLVEITGGTGAGQIFVISSNTDSTLTILGSANPALDSTSTFAIRDWGTVINTSVPQSVSAMPTASSSAAIMINDINSTWASTPVSLQKMMVTGLSTQALLLNATGGAGIRYFKTENISANNIVVSAPLDLYMQSNVFMLKPDITGLVVSAPARINAKMCLFDGGDTAFRLSSNNISGDGIDSCQFNSQTSAAIQFGTGMGNQITNSRFADCARAIQNISATFSPVAGANMRIHNCDISNSTIAGIDIDTASFVSVIKVTGTNNSTAFRAANGARIKIDPATTCTGTTELDVDGVTATLSAMRAALPKTYPIIANIYGSLIYE